jgi:hypothetical protein
MSPLAVAPRRIGGHTAQRLRRTEQDLADRGPVLECDSGDQARHGEPRVEPHVEPGPVAQFGLTVLEPRVSCTRIAS